MRTEKVREKTIEEYLRLRIKNLGGKAYKFVSPGNTGVPDRLVILPGGHTFFVELKSETGKLTPLQEVKIKELKDLGCDAIVVKSKNDVDWLIECCKEVMAQ